MLAPTLSLVEAQAFAVLRAFLLGLITGASGTPEVIRAEYNKVPEPAGDDFVVMTQIRQPRLSTNITDYFDNVLVGSIAGTTLTVSAITQAESPLAAGMSLIDTGWPTMTVAPNTVITKQLGGAPGGIGTYQVTPSQTLQSDTLYAGVRADLTPAEWVVQLDVHGPNSGNNARIIEGMFRSEYAVIMFEDATLSIAAPAFSITPLYCDDPRQVPFLNAEQQYEFRWSIDAHMQINPIIGTPQQFADQVKVKTIEAAVNYTG